MPELKTISSDGTFEILNDRSIVIQNYNNLVELIKNSNCLMVYRGDERDNLLEMYDDMSSFREQLLKVFYKRLYLLGRKSNYFLKNKKFSKAIFDKVEDTKIQTLMNLFERIDEQLSKNPNRKEVIRQFLDSNEEFVDFFCNKQYKEEEFINRLNALAPRERCFIRDYYWQFLHVIYDKYHHSYSSLISTTLSKEVAINFALGRNFDQEYFLFEYFVPEPHLLYCVTNEIYNNNSCRNFILRNNFPLVSLPPHENQNEVSVRRALLPHFILKVFDSATNSEIYNPALKDENINLLDILTNGFLIDQSSFNDEIRRTAYFRHGYFDGSDWFER